MAIPVVVVVVVIIIIVAVDRFTCVTVSSVFEVYNSGVNSVSSSAYHKRISLRLFRIHLFSHLILLTHSPQL